MQEVPHDAHQAAGDETQRNCHDRNDAAHPGHSQEHTLWIRRMRALNPHWRPSPTGLGEYD